MGWVYRLSVRARNVSGRPGSTAWDAHRLGSPWLCLAALWQDKMFKGPSLSAKWLRNNVMCKAGSMWPAPASCRGVQDRLTPMFEASALLLKARPKA